MADLVLRVFGQALLLEDQFGRRRPLTGADIELTAAQDVNGVLQPIRAFTNPISVTTDARGRFDKSVDWGTLGVTPISRLPEPEAYLTEVTDPSSGSIVQTEPVWAGGELTVLPQIAPVEEPLAMAGQRNFTDLGSLAWFLNDVLAKPNGIELKIRRPFPNPLDRTDPTPPERLFGEFGRMLDRMQKHELEQRKKSPSHNPNNFQLVVPLNPQALAKSIISVMLGGAKASAESRILHLFRDYRGRTWTPKDLRDLMPRLVNALGRILGVPTLYKPGFWIWEDMAVVLALFAGLGLAIQGKLIVWADLIEQPNYRELILSTA